jgi:hypothetical protein
MAFTFRREQEDGTPADPPVLHTAVPNWQAADNFAGRGEDASRDRDSRQRRRSTSGARG